MILVKYWCNIGVTDSEFVRYVDVDSSFDSLLELAGDVTDNEICNIILGNGDSSEEELQGEVNELPVTVALSAALNCFKASNTIHTFCQQHILVRRCPTIKPMLASTIGPTLTQHRK